LPHKLSPENEDDWKKLTAYLRRQPYTVWCSQRGFENFLKYTIERNKEQVFFDELKRNEKKRTGDLYITNTGKIKSANALARWDL